MKFEELKEVFYANAKKLVKEGNPYVAKSINRNGIFFFDGDALTREELDEVYLDTVIRDIARGYEERMVGYYDKWYRYNHADNGKAYDLGAKLATNNPKCVKNLRIIECKM